MSTISIFVASPTELKDEREKLKALANDLNAKHSKKSGTSIEIISFENLTPNTQERYDNYIQNEADLVLVIFDAEKFDKSKRKGEKTLEEYNKAIKSFKTHKHPEVIVFTHKSDNKDKKRKLDSIHKHVEKSSGSYCEDYVNIEDLKNKAKDRIKDFVKRKTSTIYNLKQILRYAIPSFATLLIAGILLSILSLDNKNHVYLSTSISSMNTKINQKDIETQIYHDMNILEEETNNKLKDFELRVNMGKGFNSSEMNSRYSSMNDLGNVKIIVDGNDLYTKIRNLLGKHDVNVSISIKESDSVIICSTNVDDGNGQSRHKEDSINTNNSISDLIRKASAFISGFYAPTVPVLYDYHIGNELDEYQSTSHWHEDLFTDAERDYFIKKHLLKEDSELAYYLLANYNEETGLLEEDNHRLKNASIYYKEVLRHNTTYQNNLKHKINIIETFIRNNTTPFTSLFNEIEKNHKNAWENSKQLIIIKGQEKIFIKDKHYYKASLYTFEREGDNQWKEVFSPFMVNLGAHGIISMEQKEEGDLSTPSGYYPIPFVFGKKNNIDTEMKFVEFGENHVWVCNPESDKYNTLLVDSTGEYKKDKKNEVLSKLEELNEYGIVIDYNTHPVKRGKGSAIFMHVERFPDHRTAGCISMPRENIINIIKWLNPNKCPYVYIRKKP